MTAEDQPAAEKGALATELAGYGLELLPILPLNAISPWRTLLGLLVLPWGMLRSFGLVLRLRPSAVLGIGGYYLDVTPDRAALARYGIMVQDVQDVIATALGGQTVTTTVEGRERYSVNVRYKRDFRSDLGALGRVLVPASDLQRAAGSRPRGPRCAGGRLGAAHGTGSRPKLCSGALPPAPDR